MYTITKQFHFSAAHQLNRVPEGHPCGRLHGHNYIVEMVLQSSKLSDQQWVRDFGELDLVKDFLEDEWDHRNLNDWFERFAEPEDLDPVLMNSVGNPIMEPSPWMVGPKTSLTLTVIASVLRPGFRGLADTHSHQLWEMGLEGVK